MKNRFLLFFLLLCTLGFAGNRDGLTPHWTGPAAIPTPTGDNMTINVIVYLDGQEVQNDNFELCTFMNDEVSQCLGGWFPMVNPEGHYYYGGNSFGYNDPVYTDDDPPVLSFLNVLTFKLWDHEGDSLVGTSPYAVIYKDKGQLGTPFHPVIINFYSGETEWVLVEDASTIEEGQELLITNVDATQALNSDPRTNNRGAWPISFADGNITWDDPDFTWDEEEEMWTISPTFPQVIVPIMFDSDQYFCLHAGNGYLYAGSSSANQLKTSNTITENSYWSITIENGEANIVAQGPNTRNTIRYNSNSSTNLLFSCYASGQNPIALYRRQLKEETPVTYCTLTYSVDPTEAGTITVSPEPGEQGYEAGTEITLTATGTDETWIFDEWQNEAGEAVNATNPYTFTITENTTLVAKFHQEVPITYYTLTVNVDPADAANAGCTYTASPEATTDGYEEGTEVTLTAVPAEGWTFVKWMDATDVTLGTETTYVVTMTANTSVWAVFEPEVVLEPYTVTLEAGSGSCDVSEVTEEAGGAGVTLPAAVPCDAAITAGYRFAGWATAAVAETTTAPELFNGLYHPEADITLYAVYMMGGQAYTFKNGANYLAWFSGNSLTTATEITDNSRWNVSFDETHAIISPVGQDKPREIEWNNSSPRFATYMLSSLYNNDGSLSATYRPVSLFKDGAAVTSLAENDVVYLVTTVSEGVTKELIGFSTTNTVYGIGDVYTDAPSVLPLTVGVDGEPATYNSNPSCEGPVVPQDPVFVNVPNPITTPSVMVEITCATEGATIYYTIDGNDPTAESTEYTEPFEITETTTVKAIAILGSESSNVVTQEYVFPSYTMFENIAAFKAGYTSETNITMTEIAMITGDVTFVYRNGRYMYVQDETAGLLIYDNSNPVITNTYENGDVISGGIQGKWSLYNKQIEMIPTANPAEGVAGTPVEPIVVTAADVVANYADYDAKLVKMETVTFDEEHTYNNTNTAGRTATFTQDGTGFTAFNRFGTLDLTVTTEQDYDVIGFVGIFNTTNQMYPRTNEDIIPITPEPETVTINATADPAVGGTIEGAGDYEVGEEVELIATPAEGYVFVNWTEDEVEVGTNATLTFTAEVDRDLVAHFEEGSTPEPETYTITVTVDPADAGTVNGAANFTGEYEEGATVTLNATPAEGYVFWEWMEGSTFVGSNPTLTFTATRNRDLVAMFKTPDPEPPTYTITVLEVENGTIAADAETAESGTTITVTANPNEGYLLTGLYYYTTDPEDVTDIDLETMQFVMPADDVTIGAEFTEDIPEPEVYTITVLDVTGGTVTAPATAEAGETITVEATANALHELTSLYYYTTDPEDVTDIDLETMQFEMPAANVFIGAVFASTAELGDANNDNEVNILDVLTVLNYILGKDPQPFDFEQADMNGDGVIDISDAMAINALIHAAKANCDEMVALYDVVDGKLMIESDYALAGYQFNLSAEPASNVLSGFTTMGNWVNGEYIFLVFNLSNDQEAGTYAVLDLGNAQVNAVALATLTGCKVNAEKGTLSVNSLEANFKVYPVPATTTVMVEGEGINFIEVYNVMGQRVMTANTQEVNVSALSAGTYMLRINTDNGVVNKSVVVVR